MTNLTDHELLQAGTPDAFSELYHRYHAFILKTANQLINTPDDLAQTAWLRILQARLTYNPTHTFMAWAARILRNLAIDEYRRRTRYPTCQLAELDFEANLIPCDETIARNQQTQTLRQLLDRLPLSERQCLYLFVVCDYDYKTIAQILKIPMGTVKSRINRARHTLHNRCAEQK